MRQLMEAYPPGPDTIYVATENLRLWLRDHFTTKYTDKPKSAQLTAKAEMYTGSW